LGIMLVAGQVAAQNFDEFEPNDVAFFNPAAGVFAAAVVIDSGGVFSGSTPTYYWYDGADWKSQTFTSGTHNYNISSFDITNTSALAVPTSAITTDDAGSTYNIGDFKITADTSVSLTGFAYTNGSPFLGTVTMGEIRVHNTGTGEAFGWHSDAEITGKLNLGTIHVTAQDAAYGVWIDGDLHDDDNLNKRSVLGNITAISSAGDAYGLFVTGEVENVFLKGDIEVIGAGVNTSGIRTGGSATLTLYTNDVAISTTPSGDTGLWVGADIWTTGDLEIQLCGKNLTTGSVKMEGDELWIRGHGRAELGVVTLAEPTALFKIGDDNFHKTTVVVDGERMIKEGGNLGLVTIQRASRLEIHGETDKETSLGVLDNGSNPLQVVSRSLFTKWGVDDGNFIRALGLYDRVQANDNYLAAAMVHHTRTGWHAVRDHLISGAVRAQPRYGYYGQAQQRVHPATRGAWVNYVGRSSYYESSFNGNTWDFTTNGVQLGTDLWQVRKHQLGVFFGHEKSKGSNLTGGNLQDRLTARDHYIGLYGVTIYQGGTDLRTVFTYGWQDYSTDRNAANGELYQTVFKGNTAELNVELGRRYYFPDRYGIVSLRPAVALDWYYNQLGGGVEVPTYDPEATSQAIRYGKADISQFFLRFGADFRYEKRRSAVEAGLYYSYDLRGSDLWASASSVDTPRLQSTLVSSQQGRSVFTFNLGGSYWLCPNLTVFGGYRGEAVLDKAGRGYEHIGHVGGAWRW